jgi:hypothetical protein
MADETRFKRLVYQRFISNAADPGRAAIWGDEQPPMVFDYNFVALRKKSAARFKAPYQYTDAPPGRFFNTFSVARKEGRFIQRTVGHRIALVFINLARAVDLRPRQRLKSLLLKIQNSVQWH